MNSVANGKVRRKTPYKNVYIQAAAGDAGGAIGAAVYVWTKVSKCTTKYFMSNAYLGPEYSNNDIQEVLSKYSSELSADSFSVTKISDEHQLCRRTANEISNGKVIGWFQGRMEWGPRALGNRSILGDPRRSDMKDILNIKIKRRESFRPFAPSILREEVSKWFKDDDDVPFMMKVFKFNDDKISLVPAVAHVDGSGRLQTVTEDSNPRYYRLIKEFKNKTGIPILLNTSFNENEPVVCTPDQALDCFIRTDMDLLVLGNWFIQRT